MGYSLDTLQIITRNWVDPWVQWSFSQVKFNPSYVIRCLQSAGSLRKIVVPYLLDVDPYPYRSNFTFFGHHAPDFTKNPCTSSIINGPGSSFSPVPKSPPKWDLPARLTPPKNIEVLEPPYRSRVGDRSSSSCKTRLKD